MQQIINLIEIAAKYFKLGFNITAVERKRPTHKWIHLLSIRQTIEELENYSWNTVKGLGAITGISNFFCLDFDKMPNADLLKKFLAHLALPTDYEWVVQSGSLTGFHIWFKMEQDELAKLKTFLSSSSKVIIFKPVENSWFHQMELRLNQHVVLPPSLHDSGNRYKFYFNNNNLDTQPIDLTADQVINFLATFCQANGISPNEDEVIESINDSPEVNDTDDYKKVIARVEVIEERQKDITGNYDTWVRLMFSLINPFQLRAKEILHRISRFHPNFSEKEFNEQFENCYQNHLRRKSGTKITLSTFFFICNKNGITVEDKKQNFQQEDQEQDSTTDTPYYDKSIYSILPKLLKDACAIYQDDRERDAFLITALAVISGILPNVYANHRRSKIAPHFFVVISAPPASGKQVITDARKLGQFVDEYFEGRYEQELIHYKQETKRIEEGGEGEPPIKPVRVQIFLPANTSSTAIHDSLSRNNGVGIIVEEEIDTLANALSQDWGRFDDLMRKAWGHEPCSYNRVGLEVVLWIKWPRLAMALGGTLNQVLRLFPSSENGNFSRVIWYSFRRLDDFVADNGFLSNPDDLKENLLSVHALKLLELYKILEQHPGVFFSFTKIQGEKLTAAFQRAANKLSKISNTDVRAIIARTMVVCSRLGMVLSTLRAFETGKIEDRIVCSDDDFNIISRIVKASIEHSLIMLSTLPKDEHSKLKLDTLEKIRLYDAIPYGEFTRDDVVNTFIGNLGIKQRTAEAYLKDFVEKRLIEHIRNGVYRKI